MSSRTLSGTFHDTGHPSSLGCLWVVVSIVATITKFTRISDSIPVRVSEKIGLETIIRSLYLKPAVPWLKFLASSKIKSWSYVAGVGIVFEFKIYIRSAGVFFESFRVLAIFDLREFGWRKVRSGIEIERRIPSPGISSLRYITRKTKSPWYSYVWRIDSIGEGVDIFLYILYIISTVCLGRETGSSYDRTILRRNYFIGS